MLAVIWIDSKAFVSIVPSLTQFKLSSFTWLLQCPNFTLHVMRLTAPILAAALSANYVWLL